MDLSTVLLALSIGSGWPLVSLYYGANFIQQLTVRWVKNPSDHFWEPKQRLVPPAGLNDSELGSHAYIQLEKVKLHYVEKGDRSKPLMLCVHGFPEFWYSWRNQLKEFSSDYWVVAVDMRGFGDSEKPVGQAQYAMDLLIADIKQLITALGKEKVTLVAHDWGGVIAYHFVLQEPQMVDSYVIMNAPHPVASYKVLRTSLDQFGKSWYVFFFQLPWLPELRCVMDDLAFIEKAFLGGKTNVSNEVLEAYKFTYGKPGALTYPINYYRENMLLGYNDRLEDLGKAKHIPAGLLLFGDKDMWLSSEIPVENAKLLVNSRLVYIKGASHFVQHDDPESANSEMRKFFTELKSAVV